MQKFNKFSRAVVIKIQSHYVKKLIKKFDLKLIVVVGGVGKTTTKLAIAKVLSGEAKVCVEEGNYNDVTSWSLPAFGLTMTSVRNPIAWLVRFVRMQQVVSRSTYPYEVIVSEWGIDNIGQMKQYGYVSPDVVVVSSISEEHMEQFGDMETVAREELIATKYAQNVLVNISSTDKKYLGKIEKAFKTYGTEVSDYRLNPGVVEPLEISTVSEWLWAKKIKHQVIGEHIRLALTAGLAVTDMLGLGSDKVIKSVGEFIPFSGRMRQLESVNGSLIVDDTYNSTPVAAIAGLSTVYSLPQTQKIAVLGSMNELGSYAEEAHELVGKFCDPKQLDLVITVGELAEKWLATAAKNAGCTVISFSSPYAAGLHLKSLSLNSQTVVYAKGSQNKIYTEEVIRQILKNPEDSRQLVRQSGEWQKTKQEQFTDYIA
jgi:UDP-N-acetylmuramoyl-tripeptide--D-alanyl-D-alanine ligase